MILPVRPIKWRCVHVCRGKVRLTQSRCYDAAGAAGGFGRVWGPLRGAGDGEQHVEGQKCTFLVPPYTHSTPPTFSLAPACRREPPTPRKGPQTRPNPPAAPAVSCHRLCTSRISLLRAHTQNHSIYLRNRVGKVGCDDQEGGYSHRLSCGSSLVPT